MYRYISYNGQKLDAKRCARLESAATRARLEVLFPGSRILSPLESLASVPACRWCSEGNAPVRSAVNSDAWVHTDTPVGRRLCPRGSAELLDRVVAVYGSTTPDGLHRMTGVELWGICQKTINQNEHCGSGTSGAMIRP